MKILINKDLTIVISKENEKLLTQAINSLTHSHNLDVSQTGEMLIIEGDTYDILTLLYELSKNENVIIC